MMADLVGVDINNYTIDRLIASGGAGTVYRASQTLARFQREVAIKVIHSVYANTPAFIRRFEAEAQIVARLEHPHIVPLYDYWRDHTGAYLVMRWMPGGSLAERLRHGSLSPNMVLHLLDQLAAALALAHGRGIVHRDVKPGNVLLDDAQNAYLADFGIAKDLDEADTSGMPLFTPGYAAPEQIVAGQITPQTDVYSLAVLLHEALTGKPPTPARFSATAPLPSVRGYPHLPTALDLVLGRATAHDPQTRYPDVIAFAADVRAALAPTLRNQSTNIEDATLLPDAPTLAAPPQTRATDPTATNPYKGLHAFHEADAADFFGRTALTERLLERLSEADAAARFLAVVGPSGAGKSSVVRAGLLPALRQGAIPAARNWFVVEMTPGAHPLEEIEAALLRVAVNPPPSLLEQLRADARGLVRAINRVLPADPAVELVLVIDQFEEVFTLAEDEAARAHLLELLRVAVCDARSRLRLVVTLRADFYDRPLRYAAFGDLVRRRTEVVLPLTPPESEQAITRPAERVGVRIEAALSAAMVHDCAAQPGALPLLQYALTELYERRVGQTLTLRAYQELGGLRGILARRADELYESLSEVEQVVAREVFLRLIALGEGTEDTRRRTRLDELALSIDSYQAEGDESTTETALERVLAVFGRHRLLTFDRDPISRSPTLELAHEALIDAWDRLNRWIDASREHLRLQRRIGLAAAEWALAERDASFLARGAQLAQFTQFAVEGTLALNATERAFLAASQQAVDEEAWQREQARRDELAQAQALADAQRRRADEQTRAGRQLRRRAFLLAGALALALIAMGAAARFAIQSRRNELAANHNAAAAQTAQAQTQAQLDVVESQRLATIAQGLPDSETQTAQLLALEAAMRNVNTVTEPVLRDLLGRTRWWSTDLIGHTDEVTGARFIHDGRQIVTAASDGTVRVWDASGKPLATLPILQEGIVRGRVSQDGTRILTADDNGGVQLWNVAGQHLATFQGHTGVVYGVDFSPDEQRVITASADGTARLWDIDGTLRTTMTGHSSDVWRAVFSPDGQRIVTASKDTTVRMWNANGEFLATLSGHTQQVDDAVFSPDGTLILTRSADGTARLWDAAGKPVAMLLPELHKTRSSDQQRPITSVTFSPDGKRILTADIDGNAWLWDTSGKELDELLSILDIPSSALWQLSFSPDGRRIVGAYDSGAVGLWLLDPNREETGAPTKLSGHTGAVNAASFSPDGQRILTASSDGTARLWDTAGKSLLTDPTMQHYQFAILENGDKQYILTSSGETDKTQLWNADGTLKTTLTGSVMSADSNEDGTRIVTGAGDGTMQMWDLNGRLITTFQGHTGGINLIDFNSDGQHILSVSSGDETTRLWNINGEQIAMLPTASTAGFSPGGQRIITGTPDGTVQMWDMAGKPLATLSGHTGSVFDLAFSPDSKLFATGSTDRTVRLWDATGVLRSVLTGHTDDVYTVQFSPDGQHILTTSADTTVRLWDLSGQLITTLSGQKQASSNAVFSPDGHYIATGSDDEVRLWTIDGRRLATFEHDLGFFPTGDTVRFSEDGRSLSIVDEDGIQWEYPMPVEEVLKFAACRVGRGLTEEEITRFQVSKPLRFNFDQRQCP